MEEQHPANAVKALCHALLTVIIPFKLNIYSQFRCKVYVYLYMYVNLSFRSNFDLYKLFYENKNVFIVKLCSPSLNGRHGYGYSYFCNGY